MYHLNPVSIKVLKMKAGVNKRFLNKLYREEMRSKKFIEHCLFVSKVYLCFLKVSRKAKVYFFTKIEMEKDDFLPRPLPDAYIAIEKNKQIMRRYFLIILDENTPRFVLRKRVHQYLDYSEEGEWEANTNHPFPSILFVCQNETVKSYLYRYIKNILDQTISDISFFLATKDSVNSMGVKRENWQEVKVEE